MSRVSRVSRSWSGQILAQAQETDTAEDQGLGQARGDELPPGWERRHADRRPRIVAGLARVEAAEQAEQAKQAERAAKAAEQARRDADALAQAQAALATEVATRVAAQHTWEQAWEHANANPGARPAWERPETGRGVGQRGACPDAGGQGP